MRTREKKRYCERLQQAVHTLREVKASGRLFNLGNWSTSDPQVIATLVKYGDLTEGACGTVACAIGWIATDSWFHKRGLSLVQYNEYDAEPAYRQRAAVHYITEYTSWEAVEKFFGVDSDEAAFLFQESMYPQEFVTIDDVIDRVNAFICTTYGEEFVVM